MKNIFSCLLVSIGLLMFGHIIHAQTLNADTLAKYRIRKIITYQLDSTGQKNIKKIRLFNDKGLAIESYSYDNFFIESKLHSMFIDSVKGVFNTNGKIASYTTNRTAITYSDGSEKTNHYSYQTTYHYKRPFIVSPFQKGTHLYVYTKNKEEIIKRYSKGRREGYFKYSSTSEYQYSFEKYYKRKHHKKRKCRLTLFNWKRHTRTIKSTLNSNGDIAQQYILECFYYKTALEYSYTKKYTHSYTGTFIDTCKTIQPYYVRTSKASEKIKNRYTRSKKQIPIVEERGILEETEFYEYITNPE